MLVAATGPASALEKCFSFRELYVASYVTVGSEKVA